MASRSTTVEKEGYMWVKRQPSVKQLKAWKWRYVALKKCSGYESRACLEWYESHDAFLVHHNPRSLPFDAIKFVGNFHSQSKEYAFILVISDQKQLQMATKTEGEKAEWIKTLMQFLHKQSPSSVSYESTSYDHLNEKFTEGASSVPPAAETRTSYPVKFKESTVNPELLNLKGDYILNVGAKYVTLLTSGPKEQQNCVLSWSLATIKSYNSRPTESNPSVKLLTIETGRQSSTGRGVFHFLTPYGQKIADQIRLNAKRSYYEKVKSQDSTSPDYAYSSSPDTSSSRFPTSSPKFCGAHMSPKLSVRSREHPVIPFHEYDGNPETNQDSFASYIHHENGYIHVLTAQEDVEKFKERKGSRPSVDYEPSSTSDDHSTYIEVLGEGESNDQSHDGTSPNEGSHGPLSDENEYHTYIHVIPEVGEREECFEDRMDDGKYDVISSHEVRHDVHEKKESDTQFVMEECVSSSHSKRWESQTSQTSSQDYSSVSSENDVFRRELSITSEVFSEEPAMIANSLQQISLNNNNRKESFGESRDSETKSPLEVENQRVSEGRDSENGEVTNSENLYRKENSKTNSWHSATGSDVVYTSEAHDDSTSSGSGSGSASDVGHIRESQELSDEEVAGDADNRHRTNSDTTNHRECSPGDSFDEPLKPRDMRPRSFTTNDVSSLESSERYSPKLLQDLLERITNPQDFYPPNNHPAMTRKSPVKCVRAGFDFKDEIADQLMHPTMAASWGIAQAGRTAVRHSAGEIKYVCSECGWYKRSRKRNVLKKAKKCERCNKLIQKSASIDSSRQKSPKSPKRDKSSILHRVARKFSSQPGPVDTFESERLERPAMVVHPKPSFVKQLNTSRLTGHNHAMDTKLGALGIAPSPARMFQAQSLGGDSRTPPKPSPPVQNESTSPTAKTLLTSSLSETSVSPSPVTPPVGDKRSPGHATVTKTVTCTTSSEVENVNKLLVRTASSPVSLGASETSTDFLTEFRGELPTKMSGGNLPPLQEVDDFPAETGNGYPGLQTLDAPPAVPPRTREEPPPVPPRRATGPSIRKGDYTKLTRAQTDPTCTVTMNAVGVPAIQEKQRISRTMTDPGNNRAVASDNIRNAVSMGNLIEENHEETNYPESNLVKKTFHSLGDGLDDTPPPLPPRKSPSASQPPPPLSPRRVSNDGGKFSNSEPTRTPSPGFCEPKRQLPENSSPGRSGQKSSLTTKRSLDARRNFQTRNPLYSERVTEPEIV